MLRQTRSANYTELLAGIASLMVGLFLLVTRPFVGVLMIVTSMSLLMSSLAKLSAGKKCGMIPRLAAISLAVRRVAAENPRAWRREWPYPNVRNDSDHNG